MDYLITEELRKTRNSFIKNFSIILVLVIFMNIAISSTNYLPAYRNVISFVIVIVFVSILLIYIIDKASIIIYNLDEHEIIFKKRRLNNEVTILSVPIKDIKSLKKTKFNNSNTKLADTYYFVYTMYNKNDDIYYCDFMKEGKLYRFIFRPSERILRILEKKVND